MSEPTALPLGAAAGLAAPAPPPATFMDRLILAAADLAGIAVLLLCALTGYDIAARFLFNSPSTWASEVSAYLLVASVFLSAAYTWKENAHIRLEIVSSRLSPERRRTLATVCTWIALVFIAFLAWQSVVQVVDSYVAERRQFSLLLTPTYLPQIPIAVGMVLLLAGMIHGEAGTTGATPARRRATLVVGLVAALALAIGQKAGLGTVALSVLLVFALFAMMVMVSGPKVAAWVAGTVLVLALLQVLARGSSQGAVLAAITVLMVVLLSLGVPIAMALGTIGLFGVCFLIPGFRPVTVAERAWSVTNSFELTAVPAFLLMGELLLASGLTNDLYQNMGKWIGRVRGGFAHASMVACAIFAAVSGSSVATAVTIGTVAAPEMVHRGYNEKLTYGSLAAGGTLGILIPPSIVMLIYGSMMGVSIGDLFIAGVVPGLLLVALFMVVILVWSLVDPSATPPGPSYSWKEKLAGLKHMAPVVGVMLVVLGGLYLGVFTPTEAGVVGSLAAILLCAVTGKLTVSLVRVSLLATVRTTCFILFIVVGAACMSFVLDYLRVPTLIAQHVKELGWVPWAVMLVIFAIYIVLGSLMDGISMMVVTLPVVFPVVIGLGYDPVWFGIIVTVLIEIGLIHPPVGLNLFVLQGVAQRVTPRTTIADIALGTAPFLLQMFILLGLLLVFPQLALWLPAQMRG